MSTTVDTALISGATTLFFGGGIIAYLKYFRESKSESRSFAEQEREKMRIEIDRANAAISALSAQVIPSNLPVWIKNSNRKYVDVNPAWEIQIGARIGAYKENVLGKTDDEVFADYPDFARIMNEICLEAESGNGLAIRKGVSFPKTQTGKIVIKEVLVHDVLGKAIFKGMAIPDLT